MDEKRGAYKPLRNMARRYALGDALPDLWEIQRHLSLGNPLPTGFDPLPTPVGTPIEHVYPQFKLDLIAREMLLHAGVSGADRTLRRANHLADLLNAIRDYGNETVGSEGNDNVLAMLHRIGHQQVFSHGSVRRNVNRSQVVYSHPDLHQVFFEQLGISPAQYLRLALHVLREAMAAPVWQWRPSNLTAGIPIAAIDAFFARISATVDDHRAFLKENEVLDVGWEFTAKSLPAKPLVRGSRVGTFCCPLVPHLVQRLFSGVYYDLVTHPKFNIPFGNAVEHLIGAVLRRGYPESRLTKPEPYRLKVKGEEFHGADWILSDGTANLFIECKGKRPRMESRTLLREEDKDADIDTLARAVAQNYQNIDHALRGLTSWIPNGLPTFSVIATLEDWVLFSPFVQDPLRERVLHHMSVKGLSETLIAEVPYVIASAADVEELACAMAEHGVMPVLTAKQTGEHAQWMFSPFFLRFYPKVKLAAEHLLEEDAAEMLKRAAEM